MSNSAFAQLAWLSAVPAVECSILRQCYINMLIDQFLRPVQQPQSGVVDPFVLIIPFGQSPWIQQLYFLRNHATPGPLPLSPSLSSVLIPNPFHSMKTKQVNFLLAFKCIILQYNGQKKSMFPAFLFPKNKTPKTTVFKCISVKYCKMVCSKNFVLTSVFSS